MNYRVYIPRAPLSDFVDLIWLSDGYAQPHAKERLLPTGTVELVINLRDNIGRIYDREDTDKVSSFRGPLVCGPHSQFFVIDTDEQASVIGVHFKPGGAFPFLKLPADELHNTHVSLETLWGAAAIDLRDQLLEARTPELKFRILEQYLLKQATLPLARHPAVTFALKEFQGASQIRTVSEVTGQIGLSPRRLIEVFSEQVGLTPKLFCRVLRFQQAIRRIEKLQQIDWAGVALDCGYFDQAHFIHDFKNFSGLNPTAYLIHRNREHLNHIPIQD